MYAGAGGAFIALVFGGITVFRRSPSEIARNVILFLIIPLSFALAAGYHARELCSIPSINGEAAKRSGTVVEARMLRYSMEAVLAISTPGEGGTHHVLAYLPRGTDIGQGDTLSFSRPPAPLSRPGPTNQFARTMGRKGISHAVRLGPDDFTVVPSPSSSLRRDFRLALAEKIDRLFGSGTAGLLKGLYFGNKNHIPKETVLSFTRAGVLHILAASGSHLATLAFLPLALLGLARLDRRGAFIITALFLALYLYATDLPVSLQRAFIMFVLGGLHLVLDHRRNPLNVLFHAAAAVLIVQPWELYSLGFQLTFGATAGILLFYSNCRSSLSFLPPVLRNPLALTISAQALVFPILALRLGEINIVSLAANLVVVPLVQLIFAASAGLLSLECLFPGAVAAAARAVDLCYAATLQSASFFAGLPGHFSPGALSPAIIVPYILFLLPVIPRGLPVFLRALGAPAGCLAAWALLAPATLPGSVTVLSSPASLAAFTVRGGEAFLYGSIGSMEDARALVKKISETGVSKAAVRLRGLDYRNAGAAAHLAKNMCLSSFTLEGGYTYGSYLNRIAEVLDADGVTMSISENGGENGEGGKEMEVLTKSIYAPLHQKQTGAPRGTPAAQWTVIGE